MFTRLVESFERVTRERDIARLKETIAYNSVAACVKTRDQIEAQRNAFEDAAEDAASNHYEAARDTARQIDGWYSYAKYLQDDNTKLRNGRVFDDTTIRSLTTQLNEARDDAQMWFETAQHNTEDRDHARAIVEELGEQATRRAAAYDERCRELDEARAKVAELEPFQEMCANNYRLVTEMRFQYKTERDEYKAQRDAAYLRISRALDALMPEDA